MDHQWLDTSQWFHSAQNEMQLFERISHFVKKLGFEYCSYVIRAPLPVSKPTVVVFDTYPKGWMQHYQNNDFLAIDSTVRDGANTTELIIWPELPQNDSARLWADAYEFGLVVGVAQSSWVAHGVYGLLSISRPAERLSTAEIQQLTLQMPWLANLSHMLMSRFLVPQLTPESGAVLTAREREVLCWTGEGKTSFEIGHILSISERTVNFHINNVLLKLGATNKVQAVVKSMAAGLINPITQSALNSMTPILVCHSTAL